MSVKLLPCLSLIANSSLAGIASAKQSSYVGKKARALKPGVQEHRVLPTPGTKISHCFTYIAHVLEKREISEILNMGQGIVQKVYLFANLNLHFFKT